MPPALLSDFQSLGLYSVFRIYPLPEGASDRRGDPLTAEPLSSIFLVPVGPDWPRRKAKRKESLFLWI